MGAAQSAGASEDAMGAGRLGAAMAAVSRPMGAVRDGPAERSAYEFG